MKAFIFVGFLLLSVMFGFAGDKVFWDQEVERSVKNFFYHLGVAASKKSMKDVINTFTENVLRKKIIAKAIGFPKLSKEVLNNFIYKDNGCAKTIPVLILEGIFLSQNQTQVDILTACFKSFAKNIDASKSALMRGSLKQTVLGYLVMTFKALSVGILVPIDIYKIKCLADCFEQISISRMKKADVDDLLTYCMVKIEQSKVKDQGGLVYRSIRDSVLKARARWYTKPYVWSSLVAGGLSFVVNYIAHRKHIKERTQESFFEKYSAPLVSAVSAALVSRKMTNYYMLYNSKKVENKKNIQCSLNKKVFGANVLASFVTGLLTGYGSKYLARHLGVKTN